MDRLTLIVLTALTALLALPLLAQPRITFEDATVRIEGVDPGATISFLNVSIGRKEWMNRVIAWDGVATDEDGDGLILLEPPHGVPLRSVWAVVERGTGAYAIASPETFESFPLAPDGIVGRARGLRTTLDVLEIERNEIELLVVRPRVEAWRLSAMDGAPEDADRISDRVLTMRFADLTPLGVPGSAVPGTLAPGDVVIAIDPEDLSHFAVVVGR